MSGWHDGYVVDVPYIASSYNFLGPAWLSFVAVINGQPPLGSRFTYVELGCGQGVTSCVVAASCPEATVWACDFNPAHIAQARTLAEAAGLSNCSFDEMSFSELTGPDSQAPDRFDVAVMHGVYSWVTEPNRRHLVEFLRRRLAPGGLVVVTYNVMTGWASMLAIQEAIARQAATDPRSSDRAVVGALETVRQLAVDGARAFPLPSAEQNLLNFVGDRDMAYLAHEFLGGTFQPLMFGEVLDQLADAKCWYLGSCSVADLPLELRVPPELVAMVGATDLATRETLCDLIGSVGFRRDVFRRGRMPLHGTAWRRHLDELVFVRGNRTSAPPLSARSSAGEASLDDTLYRPAVERLDAGPATGADLRALPGFESETDERFAVALAMLVAGGYAEPTLNGAGTVRGASAPMLNRMLVDEARAGRSRPFLVAPAITATVPVDSLVTLAVGEWWDGTQLDADALAQATRQRLTAQALRVAVERPGGDVDAATESAVAAAARQAVVLIERRFEQLGISATTKLPPHASGRPRARKR